MAEPGGATVDKQVAGLRNRHIAMISLGGTIGAGLFVGSSAAIAATGPAVVLAYLLVGGLVVLVMRMLGEMVVADPGRGSFVEYIRAAHGDRLGFTAGWLYCFFWIVALGSEAIAGAILLRDWINLPVWLLSILIIAVLKAVNFAAPRIFGECEFWLSTIKVVSIVAFVVLSALYVGHVFGPGVAVTHNVFGHGGFFPYGSLAVMSIVPTIMFSMIGAEIATVAAAESPEPHKSIARVTRSLGLRVTLFYVMAISMILIVVPWSDVVGGQSPFVAAMDVMGVPGAGLMMRIVVLSAILSCLNSCLYITSRVLTELASRGDAPAILARRAASGAPRAAIAFSGIAGTLVAFSSILAPNTIFVFLLSCSGGVILVIYTLIVTAYIVSRNKARRTGREAGHYTLPLFPLCNYATLGGAGLVFLAMFFNADQRMTALASLATSLACYALGSFFIGRREARHAEPESWAKQKA
ncbi:MAG: amino acid permease [Acetobacter sp.]|uniref:amino acid permease n=1 Tax=Acetobacter sp. TaxID=440 RepID=UPI0039EC1DD1